ncbi:hypothetical protein DH2020_039622 [Rehmannia glutinosa]|uniref:DUF2828 domain-containing protein n=1 Tax=Rehmannia glutinosa TaxID=99300 RepID=A0ABR0UVU7_REHGL
MAESTQISLLGPPEIYQQSATPTPTPTPTSKSDPFMDLMVENFNNTVINQNPPMGLTENFSPTFLSTGNPCLDFFFHVVPDTPPETLVQRLQLAWDQDPLKALKLVCHLRGVRGTGKSDKEGGYTAALWLHKHHPKTLACNVASLADFGYFKDLLEILFRLLEGPDARKLAKEVYGNWKLEKEMKKTRKEMKKTRKLLKNSGNRRGFGVYRGFGGRRGFSGNRVGGLGKTDNIKKNGPKLTREEKRIERAKRVVERFNSDPDFKLLHDRGFEKISLAAKWCPSLDSSYDKITLLCETIAKKVFPREEYPEYEGVEEAHYAYRVRDRLRKQILVPLRKALELPEVYMGANDWGSIPYNRVASVAMKIYKGKFFEHDDERFQEYLEKVETGEAKIAAGALLPTR